jgi:hypothetical protein
MPDLEHALQGHDLGFLRIVAGGWGIDLNAPDAVTALPVVVQGILDHADFAEVVESLPQDAKNVLQALMAGEGRMLWATFVRKFGDMRRMGTAKRDRERPDLKPASAVEVLWYRGLVARAFLQIPPDENPQEFAYIPDDLLPLLPMLRGDAPAPLGRPATPVEAAHPIPASDRVLDHTCTLLAALRIKLEPEKLAHLQFGGIPVEALKGLLRSARLLDYDDIPHPERTRAFLEAPRGKTLAELVKGWMEDLYFNELRLLPGLVFEGDWENDPLKARRAILELVSQVPENRWWGLSAFVSAVQEQQPDFQRPAGDYDSWFIRQEGPAGGYLRGFASWDAVDGALVRFLICGPMHWLGLVDLASSEPGGEPTALRLSAWAAALWHGSAPEGGLGGGLGGLAKEDAQVKVSGDGLLTVPRLVPRAVRYQVARFCHWEPEKEPGEYRYRVTPAGLERAKAQGLRPSQLLSLLRRYCDGAVPPHLAQALDRWETSGTQALVERVVVLRVTSPEIITALRKTRAARALGDPLNDTTILIRAGMEDLVLSALAETGYLADAMLV